MAAATPKRELSGDKAQRIIDAMRASVGARGAVASTFDHVAREAGVSRGLLHYYFGTKERLLVEVVRRDCDLRMERLGATVAGIDSADALLGVLAQSLQEMVADTPEFFAILLELHTLARHNEEIAAEVAELHRRVRGHLTRILAEAEAKGAVALSGSPEVVAEVLFAFGDGLALWMQTEPDRDFGPTLFAALHAVGALVAPPAA